MESKKLKQLHALVHLIDEPNDEMFSEIRNQIFSYGYEAIDILEQEWESTLDESLQKRIEIIIHTIQFNRTKSDLKTWLKGSEQDLLEAYLIITNFQYQEVNQASILQEIEAIREAAWLELNDNLTALEKIKVINHILFDIYKFRGTASSINNEPQSFLNTVLETKKGTPLSLSLLYLILCRKLEMPVYGIILPNNLILAYSRHFLNNSTLFDDSINEILFYINPFKNGTIFTKGEIDLYLKQIKEEPNPSHYSPCSNINIIITLLENLSSIFDKQGKPDKITEIKELLTIIRK